MIWISLIVLAYFIILVPIQYNYIKILKEKQKKMNVSQNELYDNMSYEESQIHYIIKVTYLQYLLRLLQVLFIK
ncbi:DUF3949 domain-containing protein [Bacillus pacificus]|uniref:DUF3949 domain-containing protein n=1 Tax=Bacillus pacificus TaxID=2026187 RepID=UPI00355699C3